MVQIFSRDDNIRLASQPINTTFFKWEGHCCVCKNMLMDTVRAR